MIGRKIGISSFSVLLLMTVAAVVGLSCLSLLKIQYNPSKSTKAISVSFSYPQASARVVEADVTSIIESSLANIRGCTGISSVSYDGRGSVTLTIDKRADMDAVRLEVASQIRNIRSSLPAGCSYPGISLNTHGETSQTAISYDIKSPLPTKEIAGYVQQHIINRLSSINGVNDVRFFGETPFEYVITFDADKASSSGITASQIRSAIQSAFSEDDVLGMAIREGNTYAVKLRRGYADKDSFDDIIIGKVGDRIVRLQDIASVRYQELLPSSYYRINGLNTLSLNVSVSSDANLISVVKEVKSRIEDISRYMPEDITLSVGYDYSKYLSDELRKIYFRTGLCLLILLLFVFVVSRSWRYMLIIAMTLAVNLLIAITVYVITGLHIHIYTLAGITVSLGIIIDNSVVMIDHYTRERTRSVFPALICAVMTTVSALLVVLLLPDEEKSQLTDFIWVIVINLCISLLVSYLFVPALLDYFSISPNGEKATPIRRLKRLARWNGKYARFIEWGVKHRWAFIVVFIVVFGIPLFLLPSTTDMFREHDENVLYKVAEWKPYARNRDWIDKMVGGTFALFNRSISKENYFYRDPSRPVLNIQAGMPEGCTVQQLNDIMRCMENYLANFDEIERFETSIYSARNGSIAVLFRPGVENTWLPHSIKSDIIRMATNFGGANWRVSGLDDNYFNNNIVSDYRFDGIVLSGYNYDDLMHYGECLVSYLSKNRRVSAPEIQGENDIPKTEFSIDYDFESLNARGISPYEYYQALYSPLFNSDIYDIPEEREYVNVRLESSSKDKLDVWGVNNASVNVGDGKMKLSKVGAISKKRTGLPVRKNNQSYTIEVKYNFIGSYFLGSEFKEKAMEYMNSEVLPIGYKAEDKNVGRFYSHKETYAELILLVIAIIFVICSIHFNSIKYPVAIIWMIPISFIGLFIAFGVTDFAFDKGGYAAFVMLSGITVNASIYLISAMKQQRGGNDVKRYIKAFNHKMWPITVTVISTVLGLVPFLTDGPDEVFWFSFAVGTISGLLFSVIAFVFYLPVFAISRNAI